jgi:DNA modification methylase
MSVIAGHGRVLAAKMLGLTQVPTIHLEHLTQTQAQAFTIADNRLTENSAWDEQLLAEQFRALSEVELDFGLETTGFEVAEIDLLIEGLTPVSEVSMDPGDNLPEVPEKLQVSRSGDAWALDRHRIICGNALDDLSYRTLLQKHAAAMIFADPPYNVPIASHVTGLGKIRHREFHMASGEMTERQFKRFLSKSLALSAAHSTDGSLHFICIDWRHLSELLAAGQHAYSELKNLCVWVKDNGGMGSLYRSQHELVFVFKNGKAPHRNNIELGQFGRYRTNVWQYPGVNSFSRKTDEGNLLEFHPTVKPVALVADAILDCTARNDIVLDPFLGSGTTVIAAERTGRVCLGIEIDPLYVDTAIRRWQTFTGQEAVNSSSGKSFNTFEREMQNG